MFKPSIGRFKSFSGVKDTQLPCRRDASGHIIVELTFSKPPEGSVQVEVIVLKYDNGKVTVGPLDTGLSTISQVSGTALVSVL